MAIMRWAPFSAFTSLEREMQAMLDHFGTRPWLRDFGWRPHTDVFKEGDTLVIRAEIPGIEPDKELELDIEGNVLHIKGTKTSESETKSEDRYLRECHYGSFERDVMLPEGITADDVSASYVNGVLIVKVPLPAEELRESDRIKIAVKPLENQKA